MCQPEQPAHNRGCVGATCNEGWAWGMVEALRPELGSCSVIRLPLKVRSMRPGPQQQGFLIYRAPVEKGSCRRCGIRA